MLPRRASTSSPVLRVSACAVTNASRRLPPLAVSGDASPISAPLVIAFRKALVPKRVMQRDTFPAVQEPTAVWLDARPAVASCGLLAREAPKHAEVAG